MARACARFTRREMLAFAAGFLVLVPLAERIPAVASSPSAEEVVQGLVDDIWTTLNANGVEESGRVDQLMVLLEARTDVGLISRLALGRYWNQLPEAQQEDYQRLFREVVIRSMARRLNGFAEDAKGPLEERFRIVGSAPAGRDDTLVRSRVFPTNGQPLALDWRLRAGASAPVIERHSLDGLLTELRARAASST
jgi:phospholipid transport system substrate-binding protein